MYNPQLDTFQIVAETGSFAQASRQLFITSSAVLQQINNLETNLGVPLFFRSNQGLKLTPAGEYLLEEIPHLKTWNDGVRRKLRLLAAPQSAALKIAVPKMHKNRFFYEIWTRYSALHPEATIEFTESSGFGVKEITEAYSSSDIVEFVKTDVAWQHGMHFLPLCMVSPVLSVPAKNRLSDKAELSIHDLVGETIYVQEGQFWEKLSIELQQMQEAGIHLVPVPMYSTMLIERCLMENSLVLLLSCSHHLHPSMRTIPCSGFRAFPYGFFYSSRTADGPDSFIAYAKEQLAEGNLETDFPPYWFPLPNMDSIK